VPGEEVEAFRYAIEDLRLAVFAPEIGPSAAVSPKRLTEAWQQLLLQ
jgi:ATP-dependent helicase HrpA